MDECILCKKQICDKHKYEANMAVNTIRVSSDKTFYDFKIRKYICPDCESDRPNLLRAAALVLANEADRIENEPPPEALP